MNNTRIDLKTAGVILAGGKSRRMAGQHKGSLLTNDGRTFTEHIASEMHKLTDKVYLSYGDMIQEQISGCGIIYDIFPNCGPVGGLHAAMKTAASDGAEAVLASACDMPFITADLYVFLYDQLILRNKTDGHHGHDGDPMRECKKEYGVSAFDLYDGVVCMTEERVHPLAAIYSVRAADAFEKQLLRHNLRVREALNELRILYTDVGGTGYEHMLININTESDYEKYCVRKGR